jgi:hypothetical protein
MRWQNCHLILEVRHPSGWRMPTPQTFTGLVGPGQGGPGWAQGRATTASGQLPPPGGSCGCRRAPPGLPPVVQGQGSKPPTYRGAGPSDFFFTIFIKKKFVNFCFKFFFLYFLNLKKNKKLWDENLGFNSFY